jgi:hypothetical protein
MARDRELKLSWPAKRRRERYSESETCREIEKEIKQERDYNTIQYTTFFI